MPHRLEWYPFYIRADTGAPVFIKDHERFLLTESPPPELSDRVRMNLPRTPRRVATTVVRQAVGRPSPESESTAPVTDSDNHLSPPAIRAGLLKEATSPPKPSRTPLVVVLLLALGAGGVFVYNNYFSEQTQSQSTSTSISSDNPQKSVPQSSDSESGRSSKTAEQVAEPGPVEPRYGTERTASIGSVSVDGFATQGIDMAPMGSSSTEYVVKISISDTDGAPLVFDTVRAIFFSELWGGQSMKTVKTDGGSWQLSQGERKDFSFHTDGYTGQILAAARGTPVLFAVKLLLGGQTVAGTFLAELPALRELPSEYIRADQGYALRFRTVEMSAL